METTARRCRPIRRVFSQRLTSEPLGDLMHNFPEYLRAWARGNLSCIGDEDDMGHAQRSVIMQAFSASQGALYEPTTRCARLCIRSPESARTSVNYRLRCT